MPITESRTQIVIDIRLPAPAFIQSRDCVNMVSKDFSDVQCSNSMASQKGETKK